ncbi:MAG: hypothetical protein DHS20C15_04770 [Planctomycetota bacterium]|nr:MAG: hypothetical protein DHS20C15_04770 [Planctomycetota bacterium]
MKPATLLLALLILVPASLLPSAHAADPIAPLATLSDDTEASPQADAGHASDHAADGEHAVVDRTGDASLFMDLFAHLTPHPITGVWFGGDAGFALVKPFAADEHGEPLHGTADHPVTFHSSAEFSEHYAAEFGGGFGVLIYNINTVMWIAAILLLLAFLPVAAKAKKLAGGPPRGGGYGLAESLVCFVRDEMVYAVMGKHHGRKFVPLFLSFFFFILFMNLLGLLPLGSFGGTATANLAVTAGLASVAFVMVQWAGIREHGFVSHWKNLVPHGLPIFVLPIIVPVEILGMFVKPAALTIRLFANLTAGHLIVLGLFGLVYFFGSAVIAGPVVLMTIAIYALELFVCFVQAYIFTYLSIVFLGAAVHPDH